MSNVATPPAPPPTVAYAPAPPRRRGRLLLAGLALGIALVAGTGGFALGHVTADDDRDRPGEMFRQGSGGGPFGGPLGGPGPGQGQPPTR